MLGDTTYNNIMNHNPSLIASNSFGYVSLGRGSAPTVINSQPCPIATEDGHGHAQFILEFAQEVAGNASWTLPQWVDDASGIQTCNGVYMTYNH
jgi:hypothetical protein